MRALVLRGDRGAFALVTLDLGRAFDPAVLDPLRADLQHELRLDTVIFSASHTHAGPDVQASALARPGAAAWARAALENIRAAVIEAARSAQAVRIGFATGTSWIANNRRYVRPDGSVHMISRASPKRRNFPIDPSVRVLRLDRMDGTPLAVIVHYACHPVGLSAENLKYSADWPGAMMRTIEADLPGEPFAMFVQGAPGDINLMEPLAGTRGESALERIGRSIGRTAVQAARSIQTDAAGPTVIRTRSRELTFQNRWNVDAVMKATGADGHPVLDVFRDGWRRQVRARVTVVSIGSLWSLVTMPGEPFVRFQIRLADESPTGHSWLIGYADGYVGYFPTVRAAAGGGYGASGLETWVEVGAGERMFTDALVTLYELAGKLAELPAQIR